MLSALSFPVLNTSMEGESTAAPGSLFPCLTILLGRFFSLSPASICSGATHDCCPSTFRCAPLRGAGLHLLHSSPPSSRGQQLDPPHPSPVHHAPQQYGNRMAKWETATCWEQWKGESGWTNPTGAKLLEQQEKLSDFPTHRERDVLGNPLGWRISDNSGNREDSQAYQGHWLRPELLNNGLKSPKTGPVGKA